MYTREDNSFTWNLKVDGEDSTTGSRGPSNMEVSSGEAVPLSTRWKVTVSLVFLLGILLRVIWLAGSPAPFRTADEYHFAWVGLSLLDHGRAASWSNLPAKQTTASVRLPFSFHGYNFTYVEPALDHPPLYSLLCGLWCRATGARPLDLVSESGVKVRVWDIALGRARLLSVLLFSVTFVLLFDIQRRVSGTGAAVAGAAFFCIVTHSVMHWRLLVTETLSTPFFLLGVWATIRYLNGDLSRRAFAIIAAVSSAAALLTKVIAVSQAGAICALLLFARRRRDIVFPIAGVVIGGMLYLLYGYWQGWDQFAMALHSQAWRFFEFGALRKMLFDPQLIHSENRNWLIMMGWILMLAPLARGQAHPLSIAGISYLLAFTFFASAPAIYGWHALPFYPFLCAALGEFAADTLKTCHPARLLLLLAILLPPAFNVMFIGHPDSGTVLRAFYIIVVTAVLVAATAGKTSSIRGLRMFTLGVILLCFVSELFELNEILRS
jgi:hypothetical protein